ncbi:hypothetical protein GCM10009827_119140 [Dactylosporangium maewongense]|uniref:Uncharacterized protein n=1 Tax=Dactylosporangium maewongense TaxID=634393 RepID=A0ABN2DH91_9ACTN
MEFRIGQRVLIRCEPCEVRVADVMTGFVFVEWPWTELDPRSGYAWEEPIAVPTNPSMLEWVQSPWRVQSNVEFRQGETCWLAIPEVECVVTAFEVFGKPVDMRTVPRPTSVVTLAFVESYPESERFGEQGRFQIYFTDAGPVEPVTFVPLTV